MVVPPSTGGNASTITAVRSPSVNGIAHSPQTHPPSNGHNPYPVYANHIPLSVRRAPPLDMSSVERRGQPLAQRETNKRIRPHGLQEAPTFRPTEEEFRDPMEYMRKIAPEGSKYGICKIIPPENWKPGFAVDTEKFHFRTRRQELNSVEGGTLFIYEPPCSAVDTTHVSWGLAQSGTRANLNYIDQLARFHKQNGANLNRFPSVDKRPLDLYKLKKAVETRGGFEKVCKLKKWAEIGRDLGYSGKIMSSLSTSLKNSYQKWLHPYEEYVRVVKPGMQQQLDFEYGRPLTPSPADSPMKKSHHHTPSSLRGESPAMRASVALNVTLKEDTNGTEISLPPIEAPRSLPTSGFTAVNAPGFTAVNATSAAFTAVNASNPTAHYDSENGASTPRRSAESPMTSSKNTPEYRPSNLSTASLTNGHTSNHLKRRLSRESTNGGSQTDSGTPNDDCDSNSGRRSKRLKKEAPPTVAGSHMSLLRPATPRIPGEAGTGKPGEKCEACGKGGDPASILLCDGCENGYHKHCLDPPLRSAPDYDWECPRCLIGTGEFGFEEGGIYSLKQFQEKAHNFKESYFGPKMPFDPVLNSRRLVTEDDVEREFWRLVECLTETVEVEYGADIHSTTHGSGFPTIEKNPLDPYSTDPWNLNILPLHPESLFRHIKSDISGMTVPWLYVGMCFSTFCWHNEDHYTYSANYQHFGATKTWYGIPGADAEKFEEAMRQAVPELFESQPDLLFQLVTLLGPDQLKKAGVNVYALDQRAGQFVITFPQAYHAGFNHGFNFNEAVNFAPHDWEPYGEAGVERLQAFKRQPCFSHDELLLTAAARDTTIKTAKWLAPALERLKKRELEQRQHLIWRHKDYNDHYCKIDEPGVESGPRCELGFEVDDNVMTDDEYQCSFCKAYSYLSRFRCHISSKVVCLLHAGTYECCDATEEQRLTNADHSLHYRFTDEVLGNIVQKAVDKARMPEAWQEKLDKILDDEAKPPLKALRSLVSEGERIPYDLPGLPDLKTFVDRCNEWVDEATNYITRKQQNRRKNEKAWRKGNSAKAAEMEERDRELRKIENVHKLLAEAEHISFDCPEITTLRERAEAIADFQQNAQNALRQPALHSTQEFEDLAELGKAFNVDIPEVEKLDKVRQQMKWNDQAKECRSQRQTLTEVEHLIQQAIELGIPEHNEHLTHFVQQKEAGEMWESKAKELMAVEAVHYQQLEALSHQASSLPVSRETLAAVDGILTKQREAHKQIVSLYEKSKDPDFKKRPKYRDVRDVMEGLSELNSKPAGTIDLEKEQKRHEDWMRKGKKLFGKANAPLHILHAHMTYVENRNSFCFELHDKPRMPVEPASREHTPENSQETQELEFTRDVFCICRQPEAGMMIECELCHEWYHGKCLKIARGKVKEDDKYTCPICDWRVKIPRDAARPKLEDLQDWQAEIPGLPFQPEEEGTLAEIINTAQDFRDFMRPYINPMMTTPEEVTTQRFYLRKIEGAEILLAYETNFFRQELHKWAPVAPEPPPVLEMSLSTRKPRPTKQQKMMAQLGIENPDDLPQHLRTKHHSFTKRKNSESHTKQPPPLQPAPQGHPDTSISLAHPMSGAYSSNPNTQPLAQNGEHPSPAFAFDRQFQPHSPNAQVSPTFVNSPPFMESQAGMNSPTFRASSPMQRPPGLDPLFSSGPSFGRNDHIGISASLDSPMKDAFSLGGSGVHPSSQTLDVGSGDVEDMFADLTNHHDDGGGDTEEGLAHMAGSSHASEALEVMKSGDLDGDGAGVGTEEFLN